MNTSAAEHAADALQQRKRVPDFFIVGHPKSGTTALWAMLQSHPKIYMPENKEPYFLADELRPPAATPRTFGHTPATLDEYMGLFAPAAPEQRTGEASAPYLWSRTAARRIAELRPDAKIIAILREPASFLRSLHLQFLQMYVEPEKDLRKALALEIARREGRQLPAYAVWGPRGTFYSEYIRYVEQLRRYRAHFPSEQVLVLIYDDYRDDNEAVVRSVYRFLEVDYAQPVQVQEANPTVGIRSVRAYTLMHALASGEGPVPGALLRTARTLAPRGLTRQRAIAIRNRFMHSRPPQVDEQLMAELRRRFAPEVHALSEYLDRDLVSLWGYESLG
ncbi:MAG TPA: sulfotransferase [Solirubrobacteraceae bacterium]|nr:sulfotransferase [Solirubrobacteraceae bacterium]